MTFIHYEQLLTLFPYRLKSVYLKKDEKSSGLRRFKATRRTMMKKRLPHITQRDEEFVCNFIKVILI